MASLILHSFRGEPPPTPDKLMAVGPLTIPKDLLEILPIRGTDRRCFQLCGREGRSSGENRARSGGGGVSVCRVQPPRRLRLLCDEVLHRSGGNDVDPPLYVETVNTFLWVKQQEIQQLRERTGGT